jgi:hypothetical protein
MHAHSLSTNPCFSNNSSATVLSFGVLELELVWMLVLIWIVRILSSSAVASAESARIKADKMSVVRCSKA